MERASQRQAVARLAAQQLEANDRFWHELTFTRQSRNGLDWSIAADGHVFGKRPIRVDSGQSG
jgi:hypothetical protein